MAIDVEKECLVLLVGAGDLFPGNPSRAALFRWSSHGVRGRILESVLIGGQRWTSREAVLRFMTPVASSPVPVVQSEEDRLRASRSARAAARKRHGV